jgi:hypothetical protein
MTVQTEEGALPVAAIESSIKMAVRVEPEEDEGTRRPIGAAMQALTKWAASDYSNAYVTALEASGDGATSGHRSNRIRVPGSEQTPPKADFGRLLWIHPVHVKALVPFVNKQSGARVGAPDIYLGGTQVACDLAAATAPLFAEIREIYGGAFAAGIGASAIVLSDPGADIATPMQLLELNFAYYALYMELDRRMLNVLNRWSEASASSHNKLQREAAAVFADYVRVMDVRARLDSAVIARGGDELAIWEIITEVQRFSAIVMAVERKLAVLQELADRRTSQVDIEIARRTSILAVLVYLCGSVILGVTLRFTLPMWLLVLSILLASAIVIGYGRTFRAATRASGRPASGHALP